MVVSGADYGADAADILFTRPDVCGWQVHMPFFWCMLPSMECT